MRLDQWRQHPDAKIITSLPGLEMLLGARLRRRRVKNNRLAATGYSWAFSALTASPGGKARYQRCRDAGQYHAAGLRRLFNKLLGSLYHCLQTRTLNDEATAFPQTTMKDLQLIARRLIPPDVCGTIGSQSLERLASWRSGGGARDPGLFR